MDEVASSVLDWGIAAAPLAGERYSSDHYVAREFSNGFLIAVLDGIGHVAQAATAAGTARSVLERHAAEPVISLMQRCHQELRGTRGVVISMASFNISDGLMTWLAVGNVRGSLLRNSPVSAQVEESLLLGAGVVGAQLPSLQAAVLPVGPGDTVIFATDGVQSGFECACALSQPPKRAAAEILARYGKTTDDALVLVAHHLGSCS